MNARSGPLAQRKIALIKQACCVRGSLFYSSQRSSFSQIAIRPAETATPGAKHGADFSTSATKKSHDDLISKEIFLDVLGSAATKREAKSYLSRFRSAKHKIDQPRLQNARGPDGGVNLGNLYVPARAIDQYPLFVQGQSKPHGSDEVSESLHIALVKIREPHLINDSTLQDVALTLVKLNRLGMSSVIVVDCEDENHSHNSDLRRLTREQADRVATALEYHDAHGARRLDSVLQISGIASTGLHSSVKVRSNIHIASPNLLLSPLRKRKIPVVAPIAFTSTSQMLVHVPADEAILALIRYFAGLQPHLSPDAEPQAVAQDIASMQKAISLDRVILLDPLGGIPSLDNQHRSHVFINLEQEFDAIKSELSSPITEAGTPGPKDAPSLYSIGSDKYGSESSSTDSHPISPTSATSSDKVSDIRSISSDPITGQKMSAISKIHLKNLGLLRNALAMLPPSSSGLITTAEIAANSRQRPQAADAGPGVGTRRLQNPLVHNLLTNKPSVSPSLPTDRVQQYSTSGKEQDFVVPATFFKHGMPVSIFPDPKHGAWSPPSASRPSIQLFDPRIDLPRLIELIEESFERKLDAPLYLQRIEKCVAGIVVAGDYQGCAILTWEPSSHSPSTVVPYLDKFAVLKQSQGESGVADILFNTIMTSCFPDGFCWRSRRNNPVNKWYFQRAK
ncbi:MAG: hypothetical protein Q9211_004432, partial [Gyalolechia sp. 1 TL-2023]